MAFAARFSAERNTEKQPGIGRGLDSYAPNVEKITTTNSF